MTAAFVGISLDSKAFTRSWVRYALRHVLERHEHALLVLADALFVYTRVAEWSGNDVQLRLAHASETASQLTAQRQRFFEAEIGKLDSSERARVALTNWSAFSDAKYANLWRRLWIAYSVLPRFKEAVNQVAQRHSARAQRDRITPNHAVVSRAYILDELAMCMRITELEGYHYEYHPSPDLSLATALYGGAFVNEGLSVESLIDTGPRRQFILLKEVPDVAGTRRNVGTAADKRIDESTRT